MTITVFDIEGRLVISGKTSISPGGQFSRLLPELAGSVPAMSRGYFQVRSTEPLVCIAVFGTLNDTVLAAIPPQIAAAH